MKKLLTIAALTATTMTAHAEVRINGFANFIGGITSSDETLYGYDDTLSFSEESSFAIQMTGDINDKMTATGQLVARGENDYDAKFEWAYLTYKASDNLSVSAGRFRLPLFNYSASSEVGYSYHWLSTPQTVYNVVFNNIEGIKLDYSNYAGDWEYTLSGAYGAFQNDTAGVVNSGEDTVLFSAEAIYESFKVRAVAGRTNNTIDISNSESASTKALSDGLDAMASVGLGELSDSLAIADDTGTFVGFSANYDVFDWFIGGEITQITLEDSFVSDDVAYYITAGIRKGKWTPSITYEKFDTDAEVKFQDQIDQIATTSLPDEAKVAFTQLAVGSQLGQETDYSIVTVTARYDYDTNIALKADISKYDDKLNDATDATLVRFAVNYVF